jgi:putative membrane protein insertion efficiency factor
MSKLVIFFIRIYQKIVLFFGIRVCRFYPSCSEYMVQSIVKKGLLKGFIQGISRILRCNPFHPGGYDPVS